MLRPKKGAKSEGVAEARHALEVAKGEKVRLEGLVHDAEERGKNAAARIEALRAERATALASGERACVDAITERIVHSRRAVEISHDEAVGLRVLVNQAEDEVRKAEEKLQAAQTDEALAVYEAAVEVYNRLARQFGPAVRAVVEAESQLPARGVPRRAAGGGEFAGAWPLQVVPLLLPHNPHGVAGPPLNALCAWHAGIHRGKPDTRFAGEEG